MKLRWLFWWQRQIEQDRFVFLRRVLSVIFSFVVALRHWLYDHAILPTIKVSKPVISIGNLVAGGTGKTPLVQLLASTLSHHQVAILTRGYGPYPDEAIVLQRRLPNARVYIGKDRVKLARRAIAEGADLILLDDGLQYRRLHRDVECVVLDGTNVFGGGHFLPWGLLRDAPHRLDKADVVFITKKLPDLFSRSYVGLEVQIDRIANLEGNPIVPIAGQNVALFAGLANPSAFCTTVQNAKAHIVDLWRLADHEPVTDERLKAYAWSAKNKGASILLCTEKDAVKIDPDIELPLPVGVVEISLSIARGQDTWQKLIANIEGILRQYSSST
ncbi:MAG: tetraacyldisaccharide 4-kinase [Chlamydiota bacterium]